MMHNFTYFIQKLQEKEVFFAICLICEHDEISDECRLHLCNNLNIETSIRKQNFCHVTLYKDHSVVENILDRSLLLCCRHPKCEALRGESLFVLTFPNIRLCCRMIGTIISSNRMSGAKLVRCSKRQITGCS